MSDKKFKLALCQLRTDFDVDTTMNKAEARLREAGGARRAGRVPAGDVLLPVPRRGVQNVCRTRQRGYRRENVALGEGVRGCCSSAGVYRRPRTGRMYNTCYVFDRSGAQLAKYRKMHLFDSDLPELHSHESEIFGHGNSIEVFDTEFGRMASPCASTCAFRN